MREIYREYIRNSFVHPAAAGKEEIILAEIGFDHVTTATSFVEYLAEKYRFSKSCIWYNLKKLKKGGVVDFAEKGDAGKPLYLTRNGVDELRGILSRKAMPAMARISGMSRGSSGFGALHSY